MTPAGDYLLDRATKLVQHCEHTQHIVRTVLDWVEDGHYDAMADVHTLRLPGPTVRAMRALLEPEDAADQAVPRRGLPLGTAPGSDPSHPARGR